MNIALRQQKLAMAISLGQEMLTAIVMLLVDVFTIAFLSAVLLVSVELNAAKTKIVGKMDGMP
jgi:hypothetical protein